MKKIVNGKLYNTETAKLLGEYDKGIPGNLDFVGEELYRTKKGAYFLFGHGGPLSRYSKPISSGGLGAGQVILPMEESEAKAWAEKHLTADEYLAIFEDVEEA